jgi:hypothetical protein
MNPLPHRRKPVGTYIYGYPEDQIPRTPGGLPIPQVFSPIGEPVGRWTQDIPEEFAGIIVETLLFDWAAVVHAEFGPDGQALPNARIIQRSDLYRREQERAHMLLMAGLPKLPNPLE